MNIRQEFLNAIAELPDDKLKLLLDITLSWKSQKDFSQQIPISQAYEDWLSAENDIYDELFADELTAQSYHFCLIQNCI
ncbi:MAG: hypothetical protein ACRCT1_18145 [Microcoleaceae cyanobacterium]